VFAGSRGAALTDLLRLAEVDPAALAECDTALRALPSIAMRRIHRDFRGPALTVRWQISVVKLRNGTAEDSNEWVISGLGSTFLSNPPLLQTADRWNMSESRLTEKKRTFAWTYLEHGGQQGCASAAARAAGYSAKTANAAGWRLLQDPRVRELIEAGRAELAKRSKITQDAMVKRFETLRDTAIAEKQMSAAVKAEEAVARMLGLLDSKASAVAGVKIEIVRYGEQAQVIDARAG
jgi:hypothetical protein